MHPTDRLTRAEFEREVDLVLAGSFPASDPPSWTLGVASPNVGAAARGSARVAPSAVDVVIASDDRRGIAAIVEAIGLVTLLLLGVLVVAAIIRAAGAAIASLLGP